MAFEMESLNRPRTSIPKSDSVQNRCQRQQRINSFFRDDIVNASVQFYDSTHESDHLQSNMCQQPFTTSSEDSSVFVELREQEYKNHRKDMYNLKTRHINTLFECIQLKLHAMQTRMRCVEMFQDNSFCAPTSVTTDRVKHSSI